MSLIVFFGLHLAVRVDVLALVFLVNVLLFSCMPDPTVFSFFIDLLHILAGRQHLVLVHCARTLASSPFLSLPFGSFFRTTTLV